MGIGFVVVGSLFGWAGSATTLTGPVVSTPPWGPCGSCRGRGAARRDGALVDPLRCLCFIWAHYPRVRTDLPEGQHGHPTRSAEVTVLSCLDPPRPGAGTARPMEVPTNESPRSDPTDETTDARVPPLVRAGNRALELAEGVVYAGIAAFLLVLALGAFVMAARQVPSLFSPDSAAESALEILDTLLLVFIVVELLFAVRITIAKRELIAEPFLLVGIIASIKEIVVLSVKAADEIGAGTTFSDAMWEIGVLGVLVLLLGGTALLLRRKEREPGEGDVDGPYRVDRAGDPTR
jgi:uncharacterized membrane protein (DUF373 family)